MRGLTLLILLGVCATAWSATVYKWVDDNGVVHFSDQPNPKAEKIQVQGAQTYAAPAAAVAPPPAAPAAATAPSPAVCVIDTPSGGQVFLDSFSITGHVTLTRAADGAQPALRMDGTDISSLVSPNGSFVVNDVTRGDHTLTLQVSNARGEVVCDATAVTFSVRQRSATTPGVPTVPGAPAAPRAPGVGGH